MRYDIPTKIKCINCKHLTVLNDDVALCEKGNFHSVEDEFTKHNTETFINWTRSCSKYIEKDSKDV